MQLHKNQKLRIIVLILTFSILFVWYLNYTYQGRKKAEYFYWTSFQSKVVDSQLIYGRTVEFELDNKQTIFFFPPIGNKLKIGDLIVKEINTSKYDVFRKNNEGKYEFYKTYDREVIE